MELAQDRNLCPNGAALAAVPCGRRPARVRAALPCPARRYGQGPPEVAKDEDAYEWVEVSRFQVQKEMGYGGAQLVDRIYGHAQRTPYRSVVEEYRVERHREELGDRLRALEAGSA
jgi:hypothetical protein